MTIQLFLFLFTIGSLASSLLTEALKKAFTNVSTNMIALVNACVVGFLGTISAYVLMGIIFTPSNLVCVIFMTICIWVGSMIGYDKVIQTIEQLGRK